MTKLFKALGAILFAAGLVVAGLASPAYAAVALNVSPNSIATSTATPEGFYVELTGTTMRNDLDTIIVGPPNGWSLVNTCVTGGVFGNESTCKISSVTIGGTPVTGWRAGPDGIGPKIRLYKQNAGNGFNSGAAIKITFASGAWTSPSSATTASFSMGTYYNGGGFIEQSTAPVTVGTSTYTVTFMPNGGTGVPTTQTTSGTVALTNNSFTRSGYTFAGWATSSSGAVAYANGADYVFTSSTTLYAIWTANGSGNGGGTTTVNLTLNASTGQLVAGSSVAVVASGLQATAPYTVTVQSTPQTIGSGNAVGGAVNTSVTLPSGLEAGWHTLTFTSTGSDGSAVESKSYFKVSASGTLLSTSSTIPAELANTGIDSTNMTLFLLGGLSLALIGAEMIMIARRKRSN